MYDFALDVRESERPVGEAVAELDASRASEVIGLVELDVGPAEQIARNDVVASRGIDRPETAEDRVEHPRLNLLEEAVRGDRLARRQLDGGITGEWREPGADRGDHQVGAGDAQRPSRRSSRSSITPSSSASTSW